MTRPAPDAPGARGATGTTGAPGLPADPGSLAGDFWRVDHAPDPGRFAACLALLDEIPFFRAYKADSRARLGLRPGDAVLEVGCGLGRDLAALAGLAGPTGLAVGLDMSRAMIARARDEMPVPAGAGRPVFAAGDALALPFADASFAACRVDRTLQHLSDPCAALAEMARVARPGGVVAAVEPDWGSYLLDAPEPFLQAARAVERTWREAFPCPGAGRMLARGLAGCGLERVAVEARTFVVREFALADAVYDITRTVARAVTLGALAAATGREYLAACERLDAAGLFFSSLTFFSATGVKPGTRGRGGGCVSR